MAVAENLQGLDVRRLSGSLGAEIRGISLEKAGPEEAKRIESLLMEHQVILFPDQHLTPDAHIAYGRLFGELEASDLLGRGDHCGGDCWFGALLASELGPQHAGKQRAGETGGGKETHEGTAVDTAESEVCVALLGFAHDVVRSGGASMRLGNMPLTAATNKVWLGRELCREA